MSTVLSGRRVQVAKLSRYTYRTKASRYGRRGGALAQAPHRFTAVPWGAPAPILWARRAGVGCSIQPTANRGVLVGKMTRNRQRRQDTRVRQDRERARVAAHAVAQQAGFKPARPGDLLQPAARSGTQRQKRG